ncbi:MAG: hypothetical protein WC326_03445 [Candidatus Delongbacteria bacterium]
MYARILPLLLLLALGTAGAQVLLPDHVPVGGRAPLQTGETITLAPTRVFLAPSFADSSHSLKQDRKAKVLGVQGGFYHLELEAQDAQPRRRVWVYRSELEVRSSGTSGRAAALPAELARGLASRPPAAGDTLSLAGPLLYAQQDLLGEHQVLPGRQVLTVLAPESRQGFLQVRSAAGTRGWLHRAELPEERRKAR